MRSDMQIRRMAIEDVSQVVEIYDRVYDSTYVSFGELACGLADRSGLPVQNAVEIFREEVLRLINCSQEKEGGFVAIVEGKVTGFALASLKETDAGHFECWLEDLGVLPDSQGRQIGRQLVDRVIEWGCQENAQYFLLESGFKNDRAHRFFESSGFHPLAIVFHRVASLP